VLIPSELRWTDPEPPPRDNPQDRITLLLRHPSFAQPDDEEDCPGGGYRCLTHNRPYMYGHCGEGLTHEIRWECTVHGPEIMGINHVMGWRPQGFDPPLTPEQVAWLNSDDEDG